MGIDRLGLGFTPPGKEVQGVLLDILEALKSPDTDWDTIDANLIDYIKVFHRRLDDTVQKEEGISTEDFSNLLQYVTLALISKLRIELILVREQLTKAK